MREPRNSAVLAEIPARSRDRCDEDPKKSLHDWQAFFAAIEAAQSTAASYHEDDEARQEAA